MNLFKKGRHARVENCSQESQEARVINLVGSRAELGVGLPRRLHCFAHLTDLSDVSTLT